MKPNRKHKHTDLIPSFFNMWRFVVWRLIKVFKDSLGSSKKGNSCYMTLWKVCCVIKHDMVGFYKLWKAQRPYVIQTPLHNVLRDISFVKMKMSFTRFLSVSKSSQFICTPVWGYSVSLSSFRHRGYEILCVMLSATAEVRLCSQQGMKVTVFFLPLISHFFLGDLEQDWWLSCSVATLSLQMF